MPLAVSAMLALTAHALALSLAGKGHAQPGGQAGPSMNIVDVRWVREAIPEAPSLQASESSIEPAKPLPMKREQAVPSVASSVTAEPMASTHVAAPAGAPGTSAIADEGVALDYVPRALLSVAPTPVQAVEVPFPSAVEDVLHVRGELSLFIDERGVVQRVRVDGSPIPPVLEDAARNAFLRARFTPGEVDGRPVRSLIRIEVNFDAELEPATPDRPAS